MLQNDKMNKVVQVCNRDFTDQDFLFVTIYHNMIKLRCSNTVC